MIHPSKFSTSSSPLSHIGLNALLIVLFCILCGCNGDGSGGSDVGSDNDTNVEIDIFYEEIPGSKFDYQNQTSWGYNQVKIVRFNDTVFMYVVDNDNVADGYPNATNPSKLYIYKKEGDNQWEKGAGLNISVPGNILIDSDGVLHAIIFEPICTDDDGSRGKLIHYWFPDSNAGNIIDYEQETIIDADCGDWETVNIRVGAAIGLDDTLAIGFGLFTSDKGNTEQFYYKRKNDDAWTNLIAGQNLGHCFYLPYVLVNSEGGFHILAVQDDYTGPDQDNIFQIIQYFEYKDGSWNNEIIVDLTSHELASTRPYLLEPSDFFQDSSGTIHLFYKDNTDPDPENEGSWALIYLIQEDDGSWQTYTMSQHSDRIIWIRMIEYEGEFYYFYASAEGKLYLKKGIAGQLVELDIKWGSGGLYVSAPRGGTRSTEKYIDLLLLDENEAGTYYLRILKSELRKL